MTTTSSRRHSVRSRPSPTPPIEQDIERSGLRVAVVMSALCIVVFVAALDTTIIATATPTISEQFNSAVGYVWVGSSYLLASAVFSPSLARFSDVWGRKPLLLVSNFIFFIGSLIAATSVSIGILLAGRTLQGAGGGGIIVLAQIIISDIFSERDRASYLAIVEVVWAIALALGPILGGAFTEKATWRWCFYINLPICALAFVVTTLYLDIKTPRTGFKEGIILVDWIGTLLIIAGTVILLLGLEFGGMSSWNSVVTICLIIFGSITLALFVLWEAVYSPNPLMPMNVFRQSSSCATLVVCFIHGIILISGSYFLPLYFQAILVATPLFSGVYFLPTTISTSAASMAAGIFIRKNGNYLWPIHTGLVLMTIGHGLFINLSMTSSWAKVIIYQTIAALGVGPNFQAPLVALQAMVSPHNVASATATFNFLRNIATAVSIVVGGVIFQGQIDSKQPMLERILGNDTATLFSGAHAIANIPQIKDLPQVHRPVVQDAYAESLSVMWIFYTSLSAFCLIVGFFIKRLALRTVHEQIDTGIDAEMKRLEMIRLGRIGKGT